MWFYPSGVSEEPTNYAAYNFTEGTWYSGTFDMTEFMAEGASSGTYNRTAWLDSRTRNAALSGFIEEVNYDVIPEVRKSGIMIHETGRAAQGNHMESYLESGFFEVGEGDNMAYVSRIVPDLEFFGYGADAQDPTVTVSLSGSDRPGAVSSSLATQTILGTLSTGAVAPVGNANAVRARAREMYIRIESSGNSAGWRLGDFSLDANPDGRR